MLAFSLWDIICVPFGYVMQFFTWLCGGNYVISLFLFALMVKVVMLPFSIKQQKNMIKMAKLRPKFMLIEQKYKGRNDQTTLRKKQEEMMALQQNEGYSPLAGCLPMLIQLPVIFGLYMVIRLPLKYISHLADDVIMNLANIAHSIEDTFTVAEKVSNLDQIRLISIIKHHPDSFSGIVNAADLPNFSFFGGTLDLGESPSFQFTATVGFWILFLIPFVAGALQLLTMKISRRVNSNGNPMMEMQGQDQQLSMKIMDYIMPLMTVFIGFTLSGAIGLYWIYQSIVGIIQILLLAKFMPLPTYTEEEIKAIQRAIKANKGAVPGREGIRTTSVDADGKPRSLHYDDGDDY